MKQYDFKKIESKWRKRWEEDSLYEVDLVNAKKPFYNLMMFPYPSAEGMHMGSMRTFAGIDAYGRFKRLEGYDVFQPIGLDGFGIHAENYAIKIDKHPSEQATVTENRYYDQFRMIGNGFPWSHKLETYDPAYYRWTQWLFIQMFKNGLAERKEASVNWCPSCKTVLADEQVIDGHCERCDTETVKKKTQQWFFKITRYAERLLQNIEHIDWPESIKQSQRNWIGKSTGATISWQIADTVHQVSTFTTRLDTIFGATFLVLAPEHPVLKELEISPEAENYIAEAVKLTDQARKIAEKEKTGQFTGLYVLHPLTQEKIPLWVADFVLMEYGTGAIMSVPAHDQRDYDFALKFNLPVRQVISKKANSALSYLMGAQNIKDDDLTALGILILETTKEGSRKLQIPLNALEKYELLITEKMSPGYWNEYLGNETVFIFKRKDGGVERLVLSPETHDRIHQLSEEFIKKGWTEKATVWAWLADNEFYLSNIVHGEEGVLINSLEYSGLSSDDAKEKLFADLGDRVVASTNFHLRDWLISRQRYWGPPIPMVYCERCDWQPVPESDLPVELPYVEDYKPTGDGKSPLEKANHEWLFTNCPKCGGKAKRETDVSDTFLDSAWYFLAYPNVRTDEWGGDNLPFNNEITSKWLPVNAYIGGAEHAVLHLLYSRFVTMALHDWGYLKFSQFGEPFPYLVANGLILKDGAKMSKSKGNVIVPDDYVEKFGADAVRMYLAFTGPFESNGDFRDEGMESMSKFVHRIWSLYQDQSKIASQTTPNTKKKLHAAIKRVSADITRFKYNTAISAVMEVVNAWKDKNETMSVIDAGVFLQTFSPFAPFITEELWEQLGNEASIHASSWPTFDPVLARGDEVEIVIQVNGKVRGSLVLEYRSTPWGKEEVESRSRDIDLVVKYLENKTIKQVVYVPNRLINFVVS